MRSWKLRADAHCARPVQPRLGPRRLDRPEPPVVEVAASEPEPPKPAELIAEAAKPVGNSGRFGHRGCGSGADAECWPVRRRARRPKPSTIRASFETGTAAALAQSQAALARGFEALSAEMAGLALSGMNVAARTATRLLAVKTLADAIEVNAGFTCSSFDTLVGGSAKLSELGVKLADRDFSSRCSANSARSGARRLGPEL